MRTWKLLFFSGIAGSLGVLQFWWYWGDKVGTHYWTITELGSALLTVGLIQAIWYIPTMIIIEKAENKEKTK